jgi:hypothetical protein
MKIDMTDNEIIAEFMGLKREDHSQLYNNPTGLTYDRCPSAMYDKSWDWLMPVVEKIATYVYESYESSNGYKNITEHDRAYTRTFGMIDNEGKWMVRINRMVLEQEDTLIKATYQAVVDFIKWYNSHKQ